MQTITWVLLLVAGIELAFVAVFIEFFINYKKLDSSHIAEAYAPLKKD